MVAIERNVFAWLDAIRARPRMYLRDGSLHALQDILWGYYAALQAHGTVEAVPRMDRHFLGWLQHRMGWSLGGLDWASAIVQRHPQPDAALAAFFGLVDEYRRLRPTVLAAVTLGPGHDPTGGRVRYGLDGLMEKPRRVEIVRYRPEPLHFLRFHYPDRVEDWDLLMNGELSPATSLRDAKEWVRDEFRVPFAAWQAPARRGRGLR